MYVGESYQGGLHVLPSSLGSADLVVAEAASTSVLGEDWGFVGSGHTELGDLDGDGAADLVALGNPTEVWWVQDAPSVSIFLGLDQLPSDLSSDEASVRIVGARGAGYATGHSGLDLDGDGHDELLYGDWNQDVAAVSVFSGAGLVAGATVRDLDDADQALQEGDWGAQLGRTLAGGDLDGDGVDELVVGALLAEGSTLYLLEGEPNDLRPGDEQLRVTCGHGEGGDVQALVDDVDGDGRVDLVVGVPGASRIAVYRDVGSLGGAVGLDDADVLLHASEESWLGNALAAADLDGDLVPELIVGAPGGSQVRVEPATDGRVWWLPGLADVDADVADVGVLLGEPAPDLRGHALAAWDVDDDGRQELVAAAPLHGDGAGALLGIGFTER